jgi:hypothetical protein
LDKEKSREMATMSKNDGLSGGALKKCDNYEDEQEAKAVVLREMLRNRNSTPKKAASASLPQGDDDDAGADCGRKTFSLAVLRLPKAELPPDVDPLKREDFLSNKDFLACFGGGDAIASGEDNGDGIKACVNYRVDMAAAAFGDCKCGRPKSEHTVSGPGLSKVALQKKAVKEAQEAREKLANMPAWKQENLKKKHGLF